MSRRPQTADKFLDALERGVRNVLNSPDATVAEKLAAITAGTKVAAIKHRIEGGEEESFFK